MADASLADVESSGIYQIRNLVNGKVYVGSATCFRVRWGVHRNALNKGRHHSKHLQDSWRKHGSHEFAFEILERCERGSLIEKEQAWIDARNPEFNICKVAGSTLGQLHDSGTRDKIAARAKGRKCLPRSPEYRKKLSEAHAGKKKPDHVIAALQIGRRKRVRTPEECSRVSASLRVAYQTGLRSREKTEEHKNKIGQFYAKLTDDEVRQIRSLRAEGVTGNALAKKYNSNAGTISAICNRKRYRWVA